MKTLLITGGSGYIGTHLRSHFKTKYKILSPSHKELDLCDSQAVSAYFKRHHIDIVLHAAVVGGSRGEERISGSTETNLKIFFNIIRCHKYFDKLINFGSGAEYGKQYPIIKVAESDFDRHVPSDEYGFYKYVIAKYIEETKNKIINLRIFGLFGYGENYRLRFMSNLIVSRLLHKQFVMRQNAYFDYVYISDFMKIVEFFVKNSSPYKSYNIGSGRRISLLTILHKVNTLTGFKGKVMVLKRGLNREYTCDNTRLTRVIFGFRFTPFDVALQELYDLYMVNRKLLKL
jgi:GDP-L-fucose synthase